MTDDLRVLVEDQLPRLAYQIMRPVRDIPNSAFPQNRHNFVRSADWDELEERRALFYAGPDTIDGETAYLYRGRWPANEQPGQPLMDQWYIAFYGVNLTDIDDREFESVQVDQSDVRTLEIVSTSNNNASFVQVEADRSKATSTEKEKSFSLTAETEFETQLTRSAEATVGPVSGKSELMARFKSRLEANTAGAWKASDKLEDSVKKTYNIFPFTRREITIKEGNPSIRQVIPTRGILECKVRIDIFNANVQDFRYLDDVERCWTGLLPGRAVYSGWFGGGNAVPQSEIGGWIRPHLNLDIEVRGERIRYFGREDNEFVIPGKEAEYEEARLAYNKGVEGGSR